jgi:hypothetical protein
MSSSAANSALPCSSQQALNKRTRQNPARRAEPWHQAQSPRNDVASQANTLIGEFADVESARPTPETEIAVGRPGRHLAIYHARAGYELQEELDFLTNRALEPNIFFSGRFLAPAMPRLEDRVIRLMVMRDENENRSRMRLLLPFSVEKPGFSVGASIIRCWSNPFGPLGTPLLDREEAAETLDNMIEGWANPKWVSLVFWFFPTFGSMAPLRDCSALLQSGEICRSTETDHRTAFSQSELDGDAYFAKSISPSPT